MGKKIIIKGVDFSEYAVGGSSAGGKIIVAFDSNNIGDVPYIRADKDEVVTLPTPSVEGYEFLGWYKETSYTTLVEDTITATSNITLYGKWQRVETILYDEYNWQKGKYTNTTAFTPLGNKLTTGLPGYTASARMDGNRFNILAGQTFELVTKVEGAGTASGQFAGATKEDKVVNIVRNTTLDMFTTPFQFTTDVDMILVVNVSNGYSTSSSEYDPNIDHRNRFYLKIWTPIPYGQSEV